MDPIVNRSARYFIPVAAPQIGIAEYESVLASLRSGWVSQNVRVAQFEHEFASANGKEFGVACASGTLALNLALLAAGCEHGEPVVCPTLTMVAVPNAILAAGGRSVFVDSEPLAGNPDPAAAEAEISKTNSRLCVWPSLYGEPAALPCHPRPEVLIGDNAESHYARTPDGMPLARAADMACYSYFANKVITTGEGGMVLTDDPKVAETLRSLRAHAFTPGHHFHHQRYALGCRMTEMQAALGLAQHHRYKRLLAERATIAAEFYEGLKHIEWLEFPKRSPGSVWWVFPMLVKEKSPVDRDGLRVKLAEAGVETRTYFVPMHQQPHLKKYAEGQSFPVAEYLSERGLYLGVYPGLTSAKIDYICSVIRKVA